MPHPVIEALSATALILAIAVAAIVIPTPRFKPEAPPPVVEDNAPVSQVVPASPPPPEVEELRFHSIEDKVREARADLEEIKLILKEKVEKQK